MSNKPQHCSKVKNPCKYCLEQVTNKNGLQCQGACKKWAHFSCLNFTPGKIADIKAGIIKVMCPCPDCETTQIKEYLTNPPYACSNDKCPANATGPIKCEFTECPSNKNKNNKDGQNRIKECSNKACSNDAAEAQKHNKKLPPGSTPRSGMSPARKPKKQQTETNKKVIPTNYSSSSCQNPNCQNSNSTICGEESSEPETQAVMVNALQEMCGTVGKLSTQIQELIGKINKLT